MWSWEGAWSDDFSIAAIYKLVVATSTGNGSDVFVALWQCDSPSKVLNFSRRLLHNHLPMRVKLRKRGILVENVNRSFCMCREERRLEITSSRNANFTYKLWNRLYGWLGVLTL